MVIICPPPPQVNLDPEQPVPHPGFGATVLYRNGAVIWESIHGEWFEDDDFRVKHLTDWCPRGIDWKLHVYGPLSDQKYQLKDGRWVLTEKGMGFA